LIQKRENRQEPKTKTKKTIGKKNEKTKINGKKKANRFFLQQFLDFA
jgi:hypothetical protein